MNVKITPAKLSGGIDAISSKSYAHRILLAAALCKSPTEIRLNHFSDDIKASIGAIAAMGAKFESREKGILVIPPEYFAQEISVNAKESGTTARMILPILTAVSRKGELSGEGSLTKRPFADLCQAIESNGIIFNNHNLPISYEGDMMAGKYEIAGNVSSQYISGLMYALPLLAGNSSIYLTTNAVSQGYLDITKQVLEDFGIQSGYEIKGEQEYKSPGCVTVEGDWSNASYWLCVGIKPIGLNQNSLQNDRLFTVVKDEDEIDAEEIPDLVPALAVYATQKEKPTKIYNIQRLRIKESDRVKSVSDMITALGGKITTDDAAMYITPSKLRGGVVDGCGDHRIVMSAAVASCFCSEEVHILGAQAVNKSYPQFFEDFAMLGGKVNVL